MYLQRSKAADFSVYNKSEVEAAKEFVCEG